MAKTPETYLIRNKKNYIINGNMEIAQRGTSFATAASATYPADRFQYIKQGAMVHTVSQDSDVPTLAQSGYLFKKSIRANLTTPDTSIASTDYNFIRQKVEGYNYSDLAQKPFTLSFWVKATLPGIYCAAFVNSTSDRSYVSEYTINASNTWEYKTITVAASPVAGTWDYTNGIGLSVCWVLTSGTTYQTTANTWASGDFLATANQVNGTNTGATDFRITGVMLNEGYSALPFSLFGNDYAGELRACQRYYEKSYDQNTNPGSITGAGSIAIISSGTGAGVATIMAHFKVPKRGTYIATVYNPATGGTGTIDRNLTPVAGAADFIGLSSMRIYNTATTLDTSFHNAHYTIDAEL